MIYFRSVTAISLAAILIWYVTTNAAFSALKVEFLNAIVIAQIPMALAWLFLGVRLRIIIGTSASYTNTTKAVLICQGADLVLPWRLSEVVKVCYLASKINKPISEMTAAIVVERVIDVILLGALTVVGTASHFSETEQTSSIIIIAGFAIVGVFAAPIILPRLELILARLPSFRFKEHAMRFLNYLKNYMQTERFFLAVLPGIGVWFFAYLGALAFFHMLSAHESIPSLNAIQVFIIFVASSLGAALAVLPAGIGTFEAATALALTAFGLPFEVGVVVGAGLHIANIALGVLGTIILLAVDKLAIVDSITAAKEEIVLTDKAKTEE